MRQKNITIIIIQKYKYTNFSQRVTCIYTYML